jgi:hypothetical protein
MHSLGQPDHPRGAHTRRLGKIPPSSRGFHLAPLSSLLHEPATPTSPSMSTGKALAANDVETNIGPCQTVDPHR